MSEVDALIVNTSGFAGAKSGVSMDIAVVGVLLLSVTLTLYTIPAIYSYISKRMLRYSKENEKNI